MGVQEGEPPLGPVEGSKISKSPPNRSQNSSLVARSRPGLHRNGTHVLRAAHCPSSVTDNVAQAILWASSIAYHASSASGHAYFTAGPPPLSGEASGSISCFNECTWDIMIFGSTKYLMGQLGSKDESSTALTMYGKELEILSITQ